MGLRKWFSRLKLVFSIKRPISEDSDKPEDSAKQSELNVPVTEFAPVPSSTEQQQQPSHEIAAKEDVETVPDGPDSGGESSFSPKNDATVSPQSQEAHQNGHDALTQAQQQSLPAVSVPNTGTTSTQGGGSASDSGKANESKQDQHTPETTPRNELWDEALEIVKKRDPVLKGAVEDVTNNAAIESAKDKNPSPTHFARQIKKEIEQKFPGRPDNPEKYHFVESTVSILNSFIEVGDVAATYDPAHVALPWAAVRFVLKLVTGYFELRDLLLDGIAQVTSLIFRCDMYENIYIRTDPSLRPEPQLLSDLKTSIIETYVQTQLFLGFARQRQDSWMVTKTIDTSLVLPKVRRHIEILAKKGDSLASVVANCGIFCNHQDRIKFKKHWEIADDSYKCMKNVENMLINISGDMNNLKNNVAFLVASQQSQSPFQPKERQTAIVTNYVHNTTPLVQRESIQVYEKISQAFKLGTRVALWGLGGVGKSRIANEFVNQERNNNPEQSIYWVSAASPDSFRTSMDSIILRIPAQTREMLKEWKSTGDPKDRDVPQLIQAWLGLPESSPWLLVIDNDDIDTPMVRDGSKSQKLEHSYTWYIPENDGCRVLMTTRDHSLALDWVHGQTSQVIEIPAMEEPEAVHLFRLNLSDLPSDDKTISKVKELAKLLDCLPLAIMHAVTYINDFKPMMNIDAYLDEFKKTEVKEQELLLTKEKLSGDNKDLKDSIIVTWQMNFSQIGRRHHGQAAIDLISFLAVLDRTSIPMFLLKASIDQSEHWTMVCVGYIYQFAFIFEAASPVQAPEEKVWSIHRLVHLTMKIWLLKQKQMQHWQRKAVEALRKAFMVAIHDKKWWQARLLLPHAQLALSYSTSEDVAASELRNLVVEFEHPSWLRASRAAEETAELQARHRDLENSFTWLFNHELFSQWLHGSLPMLFLFGTAGSGKSALCIRLVNYLSDQKNRPVGSRLLYYFNKPKPENQIAECLETLLRQFWDGRADIPDDVRSSLSRTLNEAPATDFLISTLQKSFDLIIEDVFIVLDELPYSNLGPSQILRILENISEKANNRHILVASRPFNMAYGFINRHPKIVLADWMSYDMETLINTRLRGIRMPDEMRHDLTIRLVDDAEGNFLWLNLVLEEVERSIQHGTRFIDLMELIETVPIGLAKLYEAFWVRKSRESPAQAKNLLTWLLFAFRPLSRDEIIEALAPEEFQRGGYLASAPPEVVADRIIRPLSDFVVATESGVQFKHRSMQDFFLRELPLGLSERSSHAQILSTCFEMLLEEPEVTHPHLLNYAAEYWTKHLEFVGRAEMRDGRLSSNVVDAWKKIFNPADPRFFLRWVRTYDPLNPEADPSQRRTAMLEDFPSQERYKNTISADVRAAIEVEA